MRPRLVCGVAAALVVLLATDVAADPAPERVPHLLLPAPRLLCKDVDGTRVCRDIPPGRFIDEPAYQELDTELRRLQTAETRLTAENASLRKSLDSWQPGWRVVLVTLAIGAAGGATLVTWIK